jgi:hypothetical protein
VNFPSPEGLSYRFFRQLGAMPNDDNPDGPVFDPVKKPVGCDDDLAEREVGERRAPQETAGGP